MTKELVDKITMLEFKQELKEHLNNVTEVLNEAKEEIIRLTKENAELKTYNEKLLNGDIEKHNKIVALEQENAGLRTKATALENANKAMVKELDDMTSGELSVLENVVRSKEQLTEAKTHIHRLLVLLTEGKRSYAVIDEARAFMKEE